MTESTGLWLLVTCALMTAVNIVITTISVIAHLKLYTEFFKERVKGKS